MTSRPDNSTGDNLPCRHFNTDQYADGKAAQIWDIYKCKQQREPQYKDWLCKLLRNYHCANVLDVACGTGFDSVMLLEEGFKVTSTDGSDKMLKYALRERWDRRKDPRFDSWVIEEANWLTLVDDVEAVDSPKEGFDAVLCLGNSFAHLLDQGDQKLALMNIKSMIKAGGHLVIDHRNFDAILDKGRVPAESIYYNIDYSRRIDCTGVYVNGKASSVTLTYFADMPMVEKNKSLTRKPEAPDNNQLRQMFQFTHYPHCLKDFNFLLEDVFGPGVEHVVYGDFKPLGQEVEPTFYIHVIQKAE